MKMKFKKWWMSIKLWKKILLVIIVVIFIFLPKLLIVERILFIILFTSLLLGLTKKSWKNILLFGIIFFIIGIIPFFIDIVCGNIFIQPNKFRQACEWLFSLPWVPGEYVAGHIFGLTGDKLLGTTGIDILVYVLIGIILGLIYTKKKIRGKNVIVKK